MESATLTRRRGSEARRAARSSAVPRPRPAWPWLALLALALGTAAGFVIYPTFPNYDSYYSLLWGRELLDGVKPSFDAYRAPTQHPLAVFFGAALSLLGDPADRVLVGATLISFVALAAGMYRLGREAFTPLIGLVAAVLLCTRFDFPFLAARGYIDIPYLAFVIWAAALEAERPRRGTPVFVLLALAGLMRPEAWLLSGLYFLWTVLPATWPQRVRYGVLTWVGPAVWVALDWWATGEPLFSLTHTSGLAEELGRQRTLREVPAASVEFLRELAKPPVFYAGLAGLALAAYLVPRRTRVPLAILVAGLGTFVLVGLAGLSVIDRYLLVPSLMVMVFAGVALAGWSMLEPGRVRTAWMAAAVAVVGLGVVFTATRVNVSSFDKELTFRGSSHASLERILADPEVRRGMACGPISVPNHKLIPDVRWVAAASEAQVLARSDPEAAGRLDRGVALLVTERTALLRQALVEAGDDPLTSVPPSGFVRVATTKHYGAYVRC
jgi:hypothetical protein